MEQVLTKITKDGILAATKELEGRRRKRVFTEADADRAIEVLSKVDTDVDQVMVYADHGDFVPNSYRYRAPMTRVVFNYTESGWKMNVGTVDAKRAHGEGPWVTVRRSNGIYRAL